MNWSNIFRYLPKFAYFKKDIQKQIHEKVVILDWTKLNVPYQKYIFFLNRDDEKLTLWKILKISTDNFISLVHAKSCFMF